MAIDRHGRIEPRELEREMSSSYLEYAMSVIVGRALPDVRDGLKPVHRRVLYAMHDMGLQPERPYVKSANIVGRVMGEFHPHGDSAIYDTLVRLAQDFASRYPLVDGQGNFGSSEFSAAAMRYTEARLSRLATEMLRDIDEDTVDDTPTYDDRRTEPVVLPSRVPNLLINGSSGIAVGMATNIPPHNLGEVIDAVVATIDNPAIEVEALMRHVKAPDFPTGGIIVGRAGVVEAYRTGRGRVIVRGRAHNEPLKHGRNAIVFTELPYQVNKAELIRKMADLANDKVIAEIADLRDESGRDGVRVVIELRRDAVPVVVLNKLYKHTAVQSTFGVNAIALVDGVPRTLGLKEMLGHYLAHQKEVVTRRSRYRLARAEARAHILEGLLTALEHLDAVIALIRGAADPETARIRAHDAASTSPSCRRARSSTSASSASPSSRPARSRPSTRSCRSASRSCGRSWATRPGCTHSSARSSSRSAAGSPTSAAPRWSRARATSTSRTSSPRRRWSSPSPTAATSSGCP